MTTRNIHQVSFADISIDLEYRGDEFCGFGTVTCAGNIVRSGRRPWWIELGTPDGVSFLNFALVDVHHTAGGVDLEIAMSARERGAMDWMLHEIRPRINTSDWTVPVGQLEGTKITVELRPVSRKIGENSATGFSYRFRYSSDQHAIYQILDRGTWELGGSAVGCEFWLRNAFAESILRIESCSQAYSTEWYLPSAENPNIFQFLPWQSGLEGLTMTWKGDCGLLTWAAELAHIRSLWEKKQGVNELEHWHEHCGDLSHQFVTAPVEVLSINGVTPRGPDKHVACRA